MESAAIHCAAGSSMQFPHGLEPFIHAPLYPSKEGYPNLYKRGKKFGFFKSREAFLPKRLKTFCRFIKISPSPLRYFNRELDLSRCNRNIWISRQGVGGKKKIKKQPKNPNTKKIQYMEKIHKYGQTPNQHKSLTKCLFLYRVWLFQIWETKIAVSQFHQNAEVPHWVGKNVLYLPALDKQK